MAFKINILTKITTSFALVVVLFGAATIYLSHRSTEREKANVIKLYEERGVAIAKALDASVTSGQELADGAQALIDKAGRSDLGIMEFSIHGAAPAGKSASGFWRIASNDPALVNTASDPEDLDAISTNTHNVIFKNEDGKRIIDVTYPLHDASGKPIATAGLQFDMSEVDKLTVAPSTYIVTLVMIAIALAVSVILSLTITSPLRKVIAVTRQIAAGDVHVTMPSIHSHDEIEELNEGMKGVLAAVQFLTEEIEGTAGFPQGQVA